MNGIGSPGLAVWKCIPLRALLRQIIAAAGRKSGKQILGIFKTYVGVRHEFQHFVLLKHSSSIRHAVREIGPKVGRAPPDDQETMSGGARPCMIEIVLILVKGAGKIISSLGKPSRPEDRPVWSELVCRLAPRPIRRYRGVSQALSLYSQGW